MKSQKLSPIGRDDAAGRSVSSGSNDAARQGAGTDACNYDSDRVHCVEYGVSWQSSFLIRMVRNGSSCSFCFDVS